MQTDVFRNWAHIGRSCRNLAVSGRTSAETVLSPVAFGPLFPALGARLLLGVAYILAPRSTDIDRNLQDSTEVRPMLAKLGLRLTTKLERLRRSRPNLWCWIRPMFGEHHDRVELGRNSTSLALSWPFGSVRIWFYFDRVWPERLPIRSRADQCVANSGRMRPQHDQCGPILMSAPREAERTLR